MTMQDSKLGCALEPNIFKPVCKTVTDMCCGGLFGESARLFLYSALFFFSKPVMFLPLPVVSTLLTNVASVGRAPIWIQTVQGEDLTRWAGRSVFQPCIKVVQHLATEFVGNTGVAR